MADSKIISGLNIGGDYADSIISMNYKSDNKTNIIGIIEVYRTTNGIYYSYFGGNYATPCAYLAFDATLT